MKESYADSVHWSLGVRSLVLNKIGAHTEPSPADAAGIRLLPSVDPVMNDQVRPLAEALPAFIASVWPLARVNFLMPHNM